MANRAALSRTLRLTTCSTPRSAIVRSLRLFSMRPRDGFSPNRPQQEAGIRIEPPPSFAWATGTIPAATATDEPPELPPDDRLRSQGLRVGPKARGSVVGRKPYSGV